MNKDIYDIQVSNRKTFINFINQLHNDLLRNPDNWVNTTLPDFLEAIAAYTNDIQGYYDNTNQEVNADIADWKVFADILMGAKVYE